MNPTQDMLSTVSDMAWTPAGLLSEARERGVDLTEIEWTDDQRARWEAVLGIPLEHAAHIRIREATAVVISFYDEREGLVADGETLPHDVFTRVDL